VSRKEDLPAVLPSGIFVRPCDHKRTLGERSNSPLRQPRIGKFGHVFIVLRLFFAFKGDVDHLASCSSIVLWIFLKFFITPLCSTFFGISTAGLSGPRYRFFCLAGVVFRRPPLEGKFVTGFGLLTSTSFFKLMTCS